jgi:exonuclease SbcD
MREIKGKISRLLSEEISSLANKEDYLRVILTDEEEIIDPMGKLRSVYPNIMSLDFENSRTSIDLGAIITDSDIVEKLSLYDLFGEFFLEVQGSVMSEEQAGIVQELLERPGEE